jgi:hypothetical protein
MTLFNFFTWLPLMIFWLAKGSLNAVYTLAWATMIGTYSLHWLNLILILVGSVTPSDK